MFPETTSSWVLYIITIVVLGALGTALWETLLRPVLKNTGRVVLRIFTLGMESARNSIYQDIARRAIYRPNLILVLVLAFIFVGFTSYSAAHLTRQMSKAPTIEERLEGMSLEQLNKERDQLKKKLKRLEKQLAQTLFTGSLLGFVYFSFAYLKNSYIISAVGHFDQCLSICSPYITAKKEKEFRSQFSRISGHDDYAGLTKELSKIAESKDIELPTFKVL